MTAWIAGASLVVGAYGAYTNSRNASSARDQQQRMYDEQMATERENQQYYRTRYGPLESKLLGYATSDGYSPDYGKALGTLSTQFANTRRNTMAQNAGYGYSGLNRGQALGLDIEKGKAIAGLGLQDDINKRQVGMQLLGHDRSFDATQGLAGAQGMQGDRYGQMAGGYNQAAQAGWGNVGAGLGGLATYLSSRQGGTADAGQLPTNVAGGTDGPTTWNGGAGNGLEPWMYGSPGMPQQYQYGGSNGAPSFDSALGGAPDPYAISSYGGDF